MRINSLILLLLILLSTSVFAWTGIKCVKTATCTDNFTYSVVVTGCAVRNDSTINNCERAFIPYGAIPLAKGYPCDYRTGAICTTAAGDDDTTECCFKTGTCWCYQNSSCTAVNKYMCTAVPEFNGIEFNEMQVSTGIIALIGAIALPMLLFRKKKQ